jgi:DNA-binding MarR family transcriptional regulator
VKKAEKRHKDPVLNTYRLFLQVAQAANKYTDNRLKKSNHLKTATYLALEGLINSGGVMSHTKLAEWTNTRKHNITGMVARMKKEGLVTTEYSPEDKRLVPITITEKGRKLYEKANSTYEELMKNIMHDIGRDKAAQLEELLMVIKSNIEKQSR